jgi:predicted nucleic acid-binding protein
VTKIVTKTLPETNCRPWAARKVAIKKLRLPARHIRAQLDMYEQFEIVQVTPAIIRLRLDLHQPRSMAFNDAIVIACAGTAGCRVLLTEDMNAGEQMAGFRIVNPFS